MDSRLTRREFLSRTGVSLAFLAGTFWRKHNVLAAQSETIKLKLAYPPSMCSLPVVLGQERNLFENHGLDLKLTATEGNSDGAMLVAQGGSGGANCCITDLTSSILAYTRGGQQLSVAYQIFLPSREERYLGLISSSQSEITTMKQLLRTLDEAPKNSIVLEMDSDVHYVTDRLLESQDVQVQQNKYYLPGSNLVRVMMNLLMGEFMAAVLPEPLLTLALKNPLFGEGRGNLLSSYPETDLLPNVVVFNNQFLNRHPDAVNRFAKA
ncbi:MAG: ABC transporter substrate-binding protein, partial [Candidatus Bipolaricaulota bacterium]